MKFLINILLTSMILTTTMIASKTCEEMTTERLYTTPPRTPPTLTSTLPIEYGEYDPGPADVFIDGPLRNSCPEGQTKQQGECQSVNEDVQDIPVLAERGDKQPMFLKTSFYKYLITSTHFAIFALYKN